jgi:1-aminocyclopropane-1-carboxylate deaminase/D-cysteine desulfhydrase-like pyridoxal-dependent ACC family enzyme
MAGLIHALGPRRVLGVDCGAIPGPGAVIAELVERLSAGSKVAELRLRHDQVGDGYTSLTPHAQHAILIAARTEGIVLDPVCTGWAMAGLIAAVRDGDIVPGHQTVFVHTGGLPGLFGHPSALAWVQHELSKPGP